MKTILNPSNIYGTRRQTLWVLGIIFMASRNILQGSICDHSVRDTKITFSEYLFSDFGPERDAKRTLHVIFQVQTAILSDFCCKQSNICKIHRLHSPVKNFLEVIHICSGYLEGPLGSGLSNAPRFMVIRSIHQKIFHFFDFFGKKTSQLPF